MKLRVLLVCLVALGLSASVTVAAAPPPGKGKPASPGNSATAGKPLPTGPTCKPKVTVVLKGTLVSASATSLSMNVTRANRWGQAWATAGAASATLDDKTKVRGNGMKTVADLADLDPGDRVLVQARACKADLAGNPPPTPTLTAARVVAHPASA